jgi:hypothetical protein
VTLQGNVGATTPLAELFVEAAQINLGAVAGSTGISITTAGTFGSGDCLCGQEFDGPVIVNGNATLIDLSGNLITFDSTVDSGSVPSSLTVNAEATGLVVFKDNVGSNAPLTGLSVTGGNEIELGFLGGPSVTTSGGSVTTSGGGQTYNGPVFVVTNSTLTDTGTGAITFLNTVEASTSGFTPAIDLTIATKGAVTFDAAVGNTGAFENLTVTGATIAFDGSVVTNNTIKANTAVASSSTLNGDITLASGVTLTASGTGNAIVIAAGSDHVAGDTTGGDFINNSGAGALVTPAGNWLVYTGDTLGSGTVDGGLTYATLFDYGASFTPSPAGNYMLFRGGFLTLTPNAVATAYTGLALDNAAYSDNVANYTATTPTIGGNPSPSPAPTLSGSMGFNGSAATVVQNAGTYGLTQGTLAVTSSDHLGLAFTNPAPNSYVITPAGLTLSPLQATASYNGTALNNAGYSDVVANYTITGFQDGQTAASVGLGLNGSMSFSGSTTTVVKNVGTYGLGQGSLALSSTGNNYALSFANPAANSYVITPASLTLTPQPATATYSATALNNAGYSDTVANYAITGLQNGETAATAGVSLSGSMSFNGSTAAVVENAGTYGLGQGSLTFSTTANNYSVSFANPAGSSYVINQLQVVLSGTRTYDATANAPASILTITNNLDGGNLTLSGTGIVASPNVGSEPLTAAGSLVLGGPAAANYLLAGIVENGSGVTITPATLTYVASPTIAFQGSVPTLNGSVTGFVGSDSLATATAGTLTFNTNTNSLSNPGVYPVDGGGLTSPSGNYVFVEAPGNAIALTVGILPSGPIDQTMEMPQSDQVNGVEIIIPFLDRRILSSDNTTPEDPTLIYSNSGDPGLW